MHIYVVVDYDTIVYAGTNKKDACNKVKGNGWVLIWQNGKHIGYIKYKNNKWKNEFFYAQPNYTI